MNKLTFIKRGFLNRVLGTPATSEPKDDSCWEYADGKICIDLKKIEELKKPGVAVRLEGKDLPARVLVVHNESGEYKAYQNRCTHMGRRLDLVPGTDTLQCCSVNKATFDPNGNKLYGPVSKPIKCYVVTKQEENLIILI